MADFDPETAGVAVDQPGTTTYRTAAAPVFDPEKAGTPVESHTSATTSTAGLDTPYNRFVKANTRPGVPLDTDQSLPAFTRARVSVETDLDKQLDLLKRQPGIVDARLDRDGKRIIATVKDAQGNAKDVLLHPAAFSLADVAGSAAPIAKTAATLGLALATDGLSLPATAAVMGGGSALVDAGSKSASRLEAGQPQDVPNLAKSAAIEGGLNAALPLAGAGVSKLSSVFRTGAGPLEANAAEAAARQGLPLTPAQATGSKVLARSTKLPGTGGEALAATQRGAIKAATDRQLGSSGVNAVPSEADIAGKVQPVIAANSEAAQAGVDDAMRAAGTAAQQEIKAQLDKGLVPTNASISDSGAVVRQKVQDLRDAFQEQAQKNYGEAYALADKEGLKVPTAPITELAKKISANDPQAALQQLVPEVGRIFKLQAALDTNAGLTLPQAVELRAVVNDKIARGEAVGDIPGRYLKNLASALSDSIEQGVKTGSPELQKAYGAARTAYAQDIGKFTDSDVGKLFTDPDSGRYLGDSEVIPALFRGRGNLDALQSYKEVLGANSPEYKLLLRQGINNLMDEAGSTGGLLDAKAFLSKVGGLSKEMRAEVLGPSADAILGNAQVLAATRGAKIDPVDLQQALAAAPGDAPRLFNAAVAGQQAADQAYNTRVMAGIRDGTFGDKTVTANPDTFVSRFLDNASTADVKTVLGQLSPETNEMIRQRTLANVLSDVRAKAAVGQATTGENIAVNSDKLVREYLSGANRAKYETILGKDGVQFLDDLATVNEAMAKESLQASGSPLNAANRMAHLAGDAIPGERGLVRTGVRALTAIPEFALGNAQRSAAVRRYLTTGELPSLSPVARAAVLSAPEAIREHRQTLSQEPPSKK